MIFEGAVGQAAPIILAAQYLDDDAQPATPTSPEALVIGGNPIAVMATLTPVESLGKVGFCVAYLDVTDVDAWPAGQYQVRWTGITSGKNTATVDTLQLVPSAQFATVGVIGGTYTTEERIRKVDALLGDVQLSAPDVALEATRAADYINGRLALLYTVPFAAPVPSTVVLLNDWKAAAMLLDAYFVGNPNRNAHSADLHKWVDDFIDALLEGTTILPGVTPVNPPGATAVGSENKHESFIMPGPIRALSARRRLDGRICR